ncbi:unnamed protein product [Orchesella dallaii]|uniref:Uncharacterized protein n=1 Tax=Orchesella dallaii TaxID=48710 RepID=A0ABP1RG75_9HEXA
MVHRSASCDTGYAWDLIEFCKNVEFLSHHLYKDVFEGMAIHPDGAFGCVHPMFKQRFDDPPNEPFSNLNCYDLENFKNNELYPSSKILMLCDSAFRLGITLMNLDATLFQNVNLSMRNYYRMLSEPVVSLKNLHASVFLMEFSNLVKIVISSTSSCTLSQRSRNSKWPCLQILDVNIDSEWLDEFNGYREETQGLMNIFFFDHVRLNLTDLRLSFTDFVHIHHFKIPCPRSIY